MMAQPRSSGWATTGSWDFIMHQAGTSVSAAGSSASTAMIAPMGTSLMRWASMMMGIGHLRPSASMVTSGPSPAEAETGGAAASGTGADRGIAPEAAAPASPRPNHRSLMTSRPQPNNALTPVSHAQQYVLKSFRFNPSCFAGRPGSGPEKRRGSPTEGRPGAILFPRHAVEVP